MTSDIIRKTRGDLMRQNTDGDPYSDPSKVYPKREYVNAPTTNLEARGIEQNELYIGGGDIDPHDAGRDVIIPHRDEGATEPGPDNPERASNHHHRNCENQVELRCFSDKAQAEKLCGRHCDAVRSAHP